MKSVRLTDETHVEPIKILGELMAEDRKRKTFDDATKALIRFWKEKHV